MTFTVRESRWGRRLRLPVAGRGPAPPDILSLVLRPIFPALAFVVLSGCQAIPDSYPPPLQREPLPDAEAEPIGSLVTMSDANAGDYIVKDVGSLESGAWRWGQRRPELRFRLSKTAGQRFIADFAVAEATFKDTGPVNAFFFINGHLLDKVRYAQSGEKHFEKAVPADWLRTDDYNMVAIESQPYWTSPADGAILTFTLSRVGFIE